MHSSNISKFECELTKNMIPVKFHQNRFSGCREVENVPTNPRPERLSLFMDRPKKSNTNVAKYAQLWIEEEITL